tara:strand:- start:204 stop:983 length:780 start_codon:yes stop_codon:yes gene_type:complete
MSAIGMVIALALPIALLMLGMVFYGRHQQKQQSKRMQARLIASRAEELQEALEFLMVVDNLQELQLLVLERVEQLYQLARETRPEGKVQVDSEALPPVDIESLRHKILENKEPRIVLKSDREIRFAKQQFSRVLKALGAMAKRKQISATTLNEYRRYLRLTLLEREVDTFTAQGDVAAERGDVVTASGYYKAARKLLIEFDLQYPEKNERIRDLSERTNALFNGGLIKEDKLSKALSREADVERDPHGIPSDPEEKRKY